MQIQYVKIPNLKRTLIGQVALLSAIGLSDLSANAAHFRSK
ncbi:MAG: hypothetical protein ACJAY2_000798 [Pseudomonadales bacterium]|jgi:hypothetical protein